MRSKKTHGRNSIAKISYNRRVLDHSIEVFYGDVSSTLPELYVYVCIVSLLVKHSMQNFPTLWHRVLFLGLISMNRSCICTTTTKTKIYNLFKGISKQKPPPPLRRSFHNKPQNHGAKQSFDNRCRSCSIVVITIAVNE